MNGICVNPRILLRPILEILKDGDYHHKYDTDRVIADKLFSCTQEELSLIHI